MIICDYLRPLFAIICKYLIIILFWLFVIICNYFWLFDDYLVMIIRDYLMIIQWLFGLNYSWLFVIIWCPQQVGRAGSLQKAFAFHRGTSWWLHLCDGALSHDRVFHVHAPGNDCIKARTTPTLLERSCNTYTMTPAPKSSVTCSSEVGCQIRIPKVGLCDGSYFSQTQYWFVVIRIYSWRRILRRISRRPIQAWLCFLLLGMENTYDSVWERKKQENAESNELNKAA